MVDRLINLPAGSIVLISGPAFVRWRGNVTVLGTSAYKEVNVRKGKTLPFEARSASKILVRLLAGGSYRICKGNTIGVSIWRDLLRRMRERPKSVMLVGATDTGKSTLAAYLSNIMIVDNLTAGLIDGDVGQGDLAPPGCIGGALVRKQLVDLRDIDAQMYAFIGTISPMGVEKLIIESMSQIQRRIQARSNVSIINTDGYVDEHGMRYKIELAKTLRPDLIVHIGDQVAKFDGFDMVHVNAPRIAKTRALREERRLAQYVRFVANGQKTIPLTNKNINFMNDICVRNKDLLRIRNVVFPLDIIIGMFVGLGSAYDVKGFGVITKITDENITIRTAYEGEFDTIMLSTIGLSRNIGREYHIPLPLLANRNEGPEGFAPS